jgi:hypothetical protein
MTRPSSTPSGRYALEARLMRSEAWLMRSAFDPCSFEAWRKRSAFDRSWT